MNIEKGRIERGDIVYATLTAEGRTIAEIKSLNASGIEEIMNRLHDMAAHYSGITSVSIRNLSRGWSMRLSMLLGKVRKPSQPASRNTEKYRQLALQF